MEGTRARGLCRMLGVVALLALACAGRGPAAPAPQSVRISDTMIGAELRMLDLLNRARRGSGLSPLSWHPRAAQAAEQDSMELHEAQALAGSRARRITVASMRVPRAGNLVALRNVALAHDLDEVHRGLMNNPNSRAVLMASSATGVGIGIVLGDEVSGRRKVSITVLVRVRPAS